MENISTSLSTLNRFGEMSGRVADFDWDATPLGHASAWPPSLSTAVTTMLAGGFPCIVLWGQQLIQIYNDGYAGLMGLKHPSGLGERTRECWPEVWHINEPIYARVFAGETITREDALYRTLRHGDLEDAWFTLSYSPLFGDAGSVEGVLVTLVETTARVKAEAALRNSERRLSQLFEQAPTFMAMLAGPDHRIELANPGYVALVGHREVVGKTIAEVLPDAVRQGYLDLLDSVFRSGEAHSANNARYAVEVIPGEPVVERVVDVVFQPLRNEAGDVTGIFIEGADVSARVASETRWQSLFEKLQEGMIVGELVRDEAGQVIDWRYLEVNLAWGRQVGIEPSRAKGQTIRELFPGIEQAWIEDMASVVNTGQAAHFTREVGALGRWYDGHAYKAEPERFIILFQEVTQRVRADQRRDALLDLNDRLRGASSTGDMALAAAQISGRALGVDLAGLALVAPDGNELTIENQFVREGAIGVAGKHWGPDYGSVMDELKVGRDVILTDASIDSRTAAFSAAWRAIGMRAAVNIPVLEKGRCVAVFFVLDQHARSWLVEDLDLLHDIADRTWTAMVLRRAVHDLQRLAGSLEQQVQDRTRERDRIWQVTGDLLGVADDCGIWLSINPAWTSLLGWEASDIIGRTSEWIEHPDDRDKTRAEVARLADGARTTSFENRFRSRDGHYVPLSWTAVPADGQLYCVARDMTQEKARAEALLQVQDALRQSQKLEAVGQLTGGVAHDFNNLLTVIRTSIDLLRRQQLPEDRRLRFMEAISNAVSRATALTGQLLAFARRQALQPTVFDAVANARSVSEMIGTLAGARIKVELRMAEAACFINADPSQFDTALVNLAINARDAMSSVGELVIAVRQVKAIPALRGHARLAGQFVAVSIADTGSGIPTDQLDRIFEPFFTTKRVGQGTGLGLSQVFGFAKQSGGEIQVESVPGQGSTFTLYLPQVAPPGLRADSSSQETNFDQADKDLILVVEDNEEVAASVDETLRAIGYTTVVVSNAASALSQLEREPERFAAVFSDVVMAGMSGIELGVEIRRRHPWLPVILSSGYSSVLSQSTDHGFRLLPKPYSLDDLASALTAAVLRREFRSSALGPAALSEVERQAELDALGILDSDEDQAYDEFAELAGRLFGAPIALISLIDRDRQWFKSHIGIDAREMPREHAFCAQAIKHPSATLVVADATMDPRFNMNPLVMNDQEIRFYAGVPLVTSTGHAVGTICVMDRVPHAVTSVQLDTLRYLAIRVMEELEKRRSNLVSPR